MKFSALFLAVAVPAIAATQQSSRFEASADVAAPTRQLRGQFTKWWRDVNDIGEGDSEIHASHWLTDYNKPMNGANRVEIAELLQKQVEKGYMSLAEAHMLAQRFVYASNHSWDAQTADQLRLALNRKQAPVVAAVPGAAPVGNVPVYRPAPDANVAAAAPCPQ